MTNFNSIRNLCAWSENLSELDWRPLQWVPISSPGTVHGRKGKKEQEAEIEGCTAGIWGDKLLSRNRVSSNVGLSLASKTSIFPMQQAPSPLVLVDYIWVQPNGWRALGIFDIRNDDYGGAGGSKHSRKHNDKDETEGRGGRQWGTIAPQVP